MWTVFSCVLSAISLAVALIFAARSAKAGSASVPRRVRSLELRVESLEQSLDEQMQLVRDLANSQKMTRVRRAGLNHANSTLPDPYKNPDQWRQEMNRRLGASRIAAVPPDEVTR